MPGATDLMAVRIAFSALLAVGGVSARYRATVDSLRIGLAPGVMQSNDAGGVGLRGQQRKVERHATRQNTLAGAERYRINEQMQLVDQFVLEQRVHQLTASVGQNVLPGFSLQSFHRLDHVVADDRGVTPDR